MRPEGPCQAAAAACQLEAVRGADVRPAARHAGRAVDDRAPAVGQREADELVLRRPAPAAGAGALRDVPARGYSASPVASADSGAGSSAPSPAATTPASVAVPSSSS